MSLLLFLLLAQSLYLYIRKDFVYMYRSSFYFFFHSPEVYNILMYKLIIHVSQMENLVKIHNTCLWIHSAGNRIRVGTMRQLWYPFSYSSLSLSESDEVILREDGKSISKIDIKFPFCQLSESGWHPHHRSHILRLWGSWMLWIRHSLSNSELISRWLDFIHLWEKL